MRDYAGGREILMIHDAIAAMLGVRRVSVSDAARNLQSAGLIRYRRGHIRILNEAALARESCECYRFIRGQYASLHGALPKLLAGK
jgi:Mn-dependent DtxR family transcriptional regulator